MDDNEGFTSTWCDNYEYEPYNVNCDGCGVILSSEEAIAEEGDRWECPECWERFNEMDKQEALVRRKVRDGGIDAP